MLAHVGIDPRSDVTWVTHPFAESARLLADGKIDAINVKGLRWGEMTRQFLADHLAARYDRD
jgi:ABC-type nitrate/sulfonate/bicarbonate transport system substrate-binding protein